MNNRAQGKRLFEVACKCGHVGRRYYVLVRFPVFADSKKEAAAIARQFPRVKHDHKDAILDVREIDQERFGDLVACNECDEYLHCRNIQEQNVIDITDRLIPERREQTYGRSYEKVGEKILKPVYWGKQKVRHPKKFMNNCIPFNKCDGDLCA